MLLLLDLESITRALKYMVLVMTYDMYSEFQYYINFTFVAF